MYIGGCILFLELIIYDKLKIYVFFKYEFLYYLFIRFFFYFCLGLKFCNDNFRIEEMNLIGMVYFDNFYILLYN